MRYSVETYQPNYHRFQFDTKEFGMGLQLMSDIHFDNPKCNRQAFKTHMEEAKALDYGIVIAGDFFCLMNGKYDPRRSKSGIRNEYNEDNYLDLVISDAVRFLEPYAHNILMISKGNHETSVSTKTGSFVLDRLVDRLNVRTGSQIVTGGYMGFYTISIKMNGSSTAFNVAYDHGHWGGIISKGTQSVVRYAAIMPQADIIHSGHTHDSWLVPQPTYKISDKKGTLEVINKWMIRTGTYKEEFKAGIGWAVEKIGMPKFLGCARTKINLKRKHIGSTKKMELKFDHSIVEA